MLIHLEITDRSGHKEITVDQASFWVGTLKYGCPAEIDLPDYHGRILETRVENGSPQVRAESGLPFPVRSVTGNVGTRFESLLDGDVLNVGPAMIKIRVAQPAGGTTAEALDPARLAAESADLAGSPVGAWYQAFMEIADTLEGLNQADHMIQTVMEGVLRSTGADRVMVQLDSEVGKVDKSSFFLAHDGDVSPFGVSQSLVEQAMQKRQVVHVPIASADPIASQFLSVRREGISSGITLPLAALGKTLGVLYADCVRDGGVLTATDVQRLAFIGRLLASALGNRALVSSLVRAQPADEATAHPALQTKSPACAGMVENVKLYSPSDYTVLIRGETGTGKEVVARCIHDLSRRNEGPFIAVNCAAIPDQLMESILFGHEKGSFTGASEARTGHFVEADGGTLFLDEVGDMAGDLQAKILRTLQDRIVMPVGSRRQTSVDVRILAATHQNLERMVEAGEFREDLYYRLRELEITIPSLRERSEDILQLCDTFLTEAARDLGLEQAPELAAATLDHLHRLPWRGNIRELRHVIKGAALRAAGGPILVSHLDAGPTLVEGEFDTSGTQHDPNMTWKERLEATEREALEQTLSECQGNLTKGAELFGVPRTTYREKLVKNGLLDKKEN
ncbi:MAG: sigma-54-dependent Fis family transcriptional regulator [Planctomycetota bacterium]|nr:sigma-54-dependent Fis family transcriptional regulator [Planctomycetota bacterium]